MQNDRPVIRYNPIALDLRIGATSAEIHRLVMSFDQEIGANKLTIYISVAGRSGFVRIAFPHVDIFRVVDDMHLPLEENDTLTIGHISDHFAYQIEGSPFWAPQREAFEAVLPGSTHYRFVTGGSCLDVISREKPGISWVPAVQD
ncbi:hypothetical protein D3C73_420740 [compost metagenome]